MERAPQNGVDSAALDIALLGNARPQGVIHPLTEVCQYNKVYAFGKRCREAAHAGSMGFGWVLIATTPWRKTSSPHWT